MENAERKDRVLLPASRRARSLSVPPEYRKREGKYPLKLLTPTYRMTITSQYHNTYGMIDPPNLYMNGRRGEEGGNKGRR